MVVLSGGAKGEYRKDEAENVADCAHGVDDDVTIRIVILLQSGQRKKY